MDSNNTIENGSSNLMLPQGSELPQESLVHVALRHRWTILSAAILSLVVAFLYLLRATPIYISTSRLYVEQRGPKIITEYEGVMTQSKNYLYTQGELIKSTPIISNVVNDAQIRQFKTFANVDNLVAYVKRNLNITIGKKDDIITISYNSAYPAEAAQIINTVVDSYIGYHSTRKRSTVSEVLNILQKEKVKRDKELSDKFEQMLEFTRKYGVVSFDNKGGHIVFQRLTKLSGALTEAQLTTINAKADFEAIKSMASEPAKIKQFAAASPTAGVRIFINDMETQLQSELRDAEVELKNVRYNVTEDHPSVKALHVKINHIKEELNKEAKEFTEAYLEMMRLKWTTAKQRENELQASFDSQRQAAQNLGIKAAEYSVLQSELKRTERLCEILDDRIKELNVTEDVGALNISILEVARPAASPSKPQKARVMTMALAMGFMAGFGLALFRDWVDYRLRSSEEISAILGIPIVGVVPTMSREQTIVTRGQKVWLKLKPIAAKAYRMIHTTVSSGAAKGQAKISDVTSPVPDDSKTTPEKQTIIERARKARFEFMSTSRKAHRAIRADVFSGAANGQAKTIVVTSPVPSDGKATLEKRFVVDRGQKAYLEPKSIVAEAYRTIRTAVFFGVPKDEAKTILVTSPAPGDGKTTLVSNLAITMAQAGQGTLILDADFRRPMQHNIFEIDSEKGLSSVLVGTHTVDEAIQPGPVKGLDILPCGPEVPNPSEILNSNLFARALKDFSERYDRVIIDSPPVTPVADSQILAAICDMTLLVLRAEKSTRKHSQQARDSLLSVGGHVFGAVVNDIPRKHDHYGHYAGYGYYGHYGYYGSRENKKQ